MVILPTMRRKLLSSYLLIVAVFGLMGGLMIAALSVTGGTPPALLHLNYDSIEAGDKMKDAWNALRHPEDAPELSEPAARRQFEQSLSFAEGNVTEAGERQVTQKLRALWDSTKAAPGRVSLDDFRAVHGQLQALISINEKAMFARVAAAKELSSMILIGNGLGLLVTLCFAVYLSDSLATKLSLPIKAIAESLRARPSLDKMLKLPMPTSVELRILLRELRRLWDSLAAANKVNVNEMIEQKLRLETVLGSLEDAFMVIGPDQTVTHCNELMERLTGVPIDQMVKARWNDLPTACANYLLLRDVLTGDAAQETEAEMLIDGKKHHFLIRTPLIRGRDGAPVGRLVLLRDITEKRQRERLRAELVDLLSHELKTPVQSLGMAAEMLLQYKDALGERPRFLIETINDDVGRIRAVSQQFIAASQTQSRSLRLDLARLPLSALMQEWLKPFTVLAEARQVQLRYEGAGDPPVWAAVDPIKFPWAISNLLSNAIRVSPQGGVVQVKVEEAGSAIQIAVEDAGPGIGDAVQRRMYEPFFQGPGDTQGVRGMLGVGLTIAKEVVEAHDGHLEYRRLEPHGSRFTITIPRPSPLKEA